MSSSDTGISPQNGDYSPPQNGDFHPASFRDPSGFLFTRAGTLYRQVNKYYQADYDLLMKSGLYASLVKAGLLVRHTEAEVEPRQPALAYKIIQPELVQFISYPYEWCFSQFKDAALATLAIQKRALESGMSLKDSSAYNIQFQHGRPVLIDTLSFEIFREGEPWVAYRQFCQHFLAPLALMALKDIRLSQLMRIFIDGVPLDLASQLLPGRTRLNFGLAMHIHQHAAAQKRYAGKEVKFETSNARFSKMALLGLVDSLEGAVKGLSWKPAGTEWAEYYDATNYSDAAFEYKRELVGRFVERVQPKNVWDMGANNGVFSRVAGDKGIFTLSCDIDPAAVEQNYRIVKEKKEENLLPLVLDLTNPSPALGWSNEERQSLEQRGPADMVLALAVIHHLAISNNVPLPQLADYFARLGTWLVIEFVPKSDSQVQRLLASRKDIFTDYNQETFEAVFSETYAIHESVAIHGSERSLYLMEKRA
ncbi:MAG: class I SAM-dependent methyltransferase [Anaerolineaceae bacterium]